MLCHKTPFLMHWLICRTLWCVLSPTTKQFTLRQYMLYGENMCHKYQNKLSPAKICKEATVYVATSFKKLNIHYSSKYVLFHTTSSSTLTIDPVFSYGLCFISMNFGKYYMFHFAIKCCLY